MSLLGPVLGLDSKGMEKRQAPPYTVYKQGHVELIQHEAHFPQIPDRIVYSSRTGRRHGEVGMGSMVLEGRSRHKENIS